MPAQLGGRFGWAVEEEGNLTPDSGKAQVQEPVSSNLWLPTFMWPVFVERER